MRLVDDLLSVELTENGEMPKWLHVFPLGSYRHPKHGILKFDEAFNRDIVAGVNNRVRGIDPVVDRDHDRGPANGWVKEARFVPRHGTDVRIDWTRLGEEGVRGKLFRYVSPEFGPYDDPSSDKAYDHVLNAVALTTRPFLKSLDEIGTVQLSELTQLEDDPKEITTEDKVSLAEARYLLTAENISKGERDSIPDGDCAGPDKSFPVRNQHEATSAWNLAGHAADPGAVRARVKAIAKRKGFSLPDTATESGKMSETADNKTDPISTASTASSPARVSPPVESTPSTTSLAKEQKMSEDATVTTPVVPAVDVVALTETAKQATAMLGEARTAMTTMREENEKMRRDLTESKLDIAFIALSESRKVELTADDGTVSAGMTKGFTAPVVTKAKSLILDNVALREPIMELLSLIQTTGMVPLSERGTSASGTDHDPFEPVSLTDDLDGSKKLAAAKAKAKTANLVWATLSADEKIGFLTMVEKN